MRTVSTPFAVAALLLAIPALTAADVPLATPTILEGQIVEARDVLTETGAGPFTEIRVQTREREESWVRLGRLDDVPNAYRIGDRVRVRLMAGPDANEVRSVLRIRNMTTGATDRFGPLDGMALRQRDRDRLQDGSCAGEPQRRRQRDRVHEPGTGGCPGGGRREGRR